MMGDIVIRTFATYTSCVLRVAPRVERCRTVYKYLYQNDGCLLERCSYLRDVSMLGRFIREVLIDIEKKKYLNYL